MRDLDIAFFRARIARDPEGALDLVRLGALLLERGRASGSEADLIAAEHAARKSLDLRVAHNAAARHLLAAALLGQHRFLEARHAAERLREADPQSPTARALLGEVLLELGEYPAADSIFRALVLRRDDPAVGPRYARWLELRGRAGEARRLLERLREDAARRDLLPPDLAAWYDLRLGELALRYDAVAEARRRAESGLATAPRDWRLLALRARVALRARNSLLAIELGDSSLALHPDPATFALVGDAWRAHGRPERSRDYYRALETSVPGPRAGFHRAWYLALLDHDRRVSEVLEAARRELDTRRDVYGWDVYAWALFKSGRVAEARSAIGEALAWSTEDPMIHRHARVIRSAE